MIRSLFAASALLLAAAPAYAAGAEHSFTRDGVTYHYTVTSKGDSVFVRGFQDSSSRPFYLRIRNGKVRGVSNGWPVAFDVAEAQDATVKVAER